MGIIAEYDSCSFLGRLLAVFSKFEAMQQICSLFRCYHRRGHDSFVTDFVLLTFLLLLLVTDQSWEKSLNENPMLANRDQGRAIVSTTDPGEKTTVGLTTDTNDYGDPLETSTTPKVTDSTTVDSMPGENMTKPENETTTTLEPETTTEPLYPAPVEFFEAYRSNYEMVKFMISLTDTHSDRVKMIRIGRTSNGRSMWILRIGSSEGDPPKKRKIVWVDSLINPREWITGASSLYLAYKLLNNETYSPILQKIDFVIAPVLNPDGYVFSFQNINNRQWYRTRNRIANKKSDCWGTDLDRNFNFSFERDVGTDFVGCGADAGPSAFSTEETRSISKFFLETGRTDEFKMCISLRSPGQMILRPFAYSEIDTTDIMEQEEMQKLAQSTIKNFTGSEYECKTYWEHKRVTGAFIDWVYKMMQVVHTYAYLLGPGEKTETDPLKLDVTTIPQVGEELVQAIIAMTASLISKDERTTTTTTIETPETTTGEPPTTQTGETTETPNQDTSPQTTTVPSEETSVSTTDPTPSTNGSTVISLNVPPVTDASQNDEEA